MVVAAGGGMVVAGTTTTTAIIIITIIMVSNDCSPGTITAMAVVSSLLQLHLIKRLVSCD